VAPSWRIGAAYFGLYLLLDWASYVEPLPHTSITPCNPNTGSSWRCCWHAERAGLHSSLLLRVNRAALCDEIRRNKHHLVLPALAA
jgi:hypothetical protein